MKRTGNLPTEEQIRKRAYEIYVSRGSSDGQEVSDWLQAEQELIEPGDKRTRAQASGI